MLTKEEQQALRTLEDVSCGILFSSKRWKPGEYIMSLPPRTRERLKKLTSRATQSLRPDAILM